MEALQGRLMLQERLPPRGYPSPLLTQALGDAEQPDQLRVGLEVGERPQLFQKKNSVGRPPGQRAVGWRLLQLAPVSVDSLGSVSRRYQ